MRGSRRIRTQFSLEAGARRRGHQPRPSNPLGAGRLLERGIVDFLISGAGSGLSSGWWESANYLMTLPSALGPGRKTAMKPTSVVEPLAATQESSMAQILPSNFSEDARPWADAAGRAIRARTSPASPAASAPSRPEARHDAGRGAKCLSERGQRAHRDGGPGETVLPPRLGAQARRGGSVPWAQQLEREVGEVSWGVEITLKLRRGLALHRGEVAVGAPSLLTFPVGEGGSRSRDGWGGRGRARGRKPKPGRKHPALAFPTAVCF